MNKNQKIAKNLLSANNINPSYYRIIILEYMIKNKKCSKADGLYKAICRIIPTISKATLYNNLIIFEINNIISKVCFSQDDVRYCFNDGRFYIYFKCTKCSAIYRIEHNTGFLQSNTINGHRIDKLHAVSYGICKKCL